MDKQFMDIFGAFSEMSRADREFMLESLESLHNVKKHKENMDDFNKGKRLSEIFPTDHATDFYRGERGICSYQENRGREDRSEEQNY